MDRLALVREGVRRLLRASCGERNYDRLVALEGEADPSGAFAPLGGIKSWVRA